MSDEILSRIGEWCEAAADLELDGTKVTVAGDPPVAVDVDAGDDAVTLRHTHVVGEIHEDFAPKARDLLGGRGSMIEGDIATDDDGTRVEIRYPIYLDGLNRQTFLLAIRDITATADSLTEIAGPAGGEAAAGAEADEPMVPASEPEADAEPEPEPEPEAAATAETVIVDEAAAWAATHTVPGGGLSAWAEPDPALAPVAKLAPRVELQVNEVRGAWALVTGSNGWTGWVDGRKLRPIGAGGTGRVPAATAAGAAPAVAGAGGTTLRPLAALGGLAMIIAAFIPWNATGFGTSGTGVPYEIAAGKATDWPLAFIWNSLSPGQPRIAWLVLILGLVAIAAAILPRIPPVVTIVVGAVGLLIGLLFLVQLSRLPGWSDTFKIVQAGFWVFLVGAIVTMIPTRLEL